MKRSLIYVEDISELTAKVFFDAISLCESLSQKPNLILRESRLLPSKIAEIVERKDVKFLEDFSGVQPELEFLDRIKLDEDLLIVVIGTKRRINEYFYDRIKCNSGGPIKWEIISAEYTRFTLVEKQHSLDDFIPVDTQLWIKNLIKKYGTDYILKAVQDIKKINCAVIGESIIDEYIYCDALGKASKDPILAFAKGETIRQLGGVLAAAKHLAGLGASTMLVSEINPNEHDFVLSQLEYLPNLKSWISCSRGGVIKTRYVERVTLSRIFQTYTAERNYSNVDFQNYLKGFFNSINVENVIVMDYGHDLFDVDLIDFLLNLNLPISVNAQSNAQNRGFNSIAKYKGAERVFLNGTEVLLEIRDKNPDLTIAVPELCSRLEFKEAYVTNGARGIISWSNSQSMQVAPAFAPRILDRIGAGDATLAMISALRMADTPIDIALFFGNIAGAMLVGSMGNEISLRTELVLSQAEKILRKVSQGD